MSTKLHSHKKIKIKISGYIVQVVPSSSLEKSYGRKGVMGELCAPGYLRIMIREEKTNKQLHLIRVFTNQYISDPSHYEENVTARQLSQMLSALYKTGPNPNGKKELRDDLYKQMRQAEPGGQWERVIYRELNELEN